MLGPVIEGAGMGVHHKTASKMFMLKGKRVNSLGSGVFLRLNSTSRIYDLEQIKLLNFP